MAAAVVLMLISLFDVDDDLSQSLYRVGLALSVLAATGWVLMRSSATEEYVEMVRQQAYDEGYSDGCEVARVTQFRRPSSRIAPSAAVVPSDSPTHQLGQQSDIGKGA